MNNSVGWNKISKSYQKRYDIKYSYYYWGPLCPPKLDNLLLPIKNKKILELGSGAAQNSIYLASRGAKVTALDISENQIDFGKKLAENADVEIKFVVGDFEKVSEYFSKQSFDKVVSSFALQYCTTVKTLNKTIKQIFDILKEGGEFIFSIDHPIRHHGHWNGKDFILDNYFDRKLRSWNYTFPEDNISATMHGSFKTIGDYISAILNAGFTIKDVLEPEPVANTKSNNFATKSRYVKDSSKNPFTYEHLKRIPGTIIFKAIKNEERK